MWACMPYGFWGAYCPVCKPEPEEIAYENERKILWKKEKK
jgi:hypothetical protein